MVCGKGPSIGKKAKKAFKKAEKPLIGLATGGLSYVASGAKDYFMPKVPDINFPDEAPAGPTVPMPDEEQISRSRRRRRNSGRLSTILSDDGLGG